MSFPTNQGEPWSEGVIVQTVVAALPRASHLVLGNSLPVRMIDLYCRHQMANLAVASQRGVSGIDGYLASTGGYADALQEPTTLLLGDVTFLHDLSSLGIAQRAGSRTSVAIVVIQNGGGRIFEQLPLAAVSGLEQEIMQHVTTPHSLDISHLARFYDVPFVRVNDEAGLKDALAGAHAKPGCTLIEAIAPDHDAAPRLRRVVGELESAVAGARVSR